MERIQNQAGNSASEEEWPGLPAGFDILTYRRSHWLVLRIDAGPVILSGLAHAQPLISIDAALKRGQPARTEAVTSVLASVRAEDPVRSVTSWWRDHLANCKALGLECVADDDLRRGIKQSESEPLERLPEMLKDWRDARARTEETQRVARRVASAVRLEDYGQLFPAAQRRRKVVAILGPTNSGKTHLALERLAAAKTGFYAGPLRLLALEVYDRLNRDFGVVCSLITGEERRVMPGATHTACTVEMVSPTQEVEVAVVDEFQLIADRQRGWAWTQALAAANAQEVYVLGSAQSRGVLEEFGRLLNVDVEVRVVERLSPLQLAEAPLGRTAREALRNVRRGDCLVVFTRRDCLLLRDDLIECGLEVSCIYGALSPEARQRQAERFTRGESDVMVATDAIGLGLNLKGLRRAILVASQKFDGRSRRDVPLDLVRQIVGRAGRFGLSEDAAGLALGLTRTEHELVETALRTSPRNVELAKLPVAPSGEVLKKLEEIAGESRLTVLLQLFVDHCSAGGYEAQLPGDAMERAYAVDQYDLGVDVRFALTQVPVSTRDESVVRQWHAWARALENKEQCSDLSFVEHGVNTLESAERDVQTLTGYCWLAMKWPETFVAEVKARELLRERSGTVEERLRSRAKLGGKGLGASVGLPGWYWLRREEEVEMW